jgi:hypothetical protein
MYNLVIVRHFDKNEPDMYDKVTVEMDGETLHEFGDYYHDKGYEKASAYTLAFFDLFGTDEVTVRDEDRGSEE